MAGSAYAITCTYETGDGSTISMRKVCHHNWAQSPEGDTCNPDGANCLYLAPDEKVVCKHTRFAGPCKDSKCPAVDGTTCLIINTRQTVGKHNDEIYNGNSNKDNDAFGVINPPWGPSFWNKTAVVVMDMWDHHHNYVSSLRVDELAPAINHFCYALRAKGALIAHSPSDVSEYFKGRAVDGKTVTPNELAARERGRMARLPGPPDAASPRTYAWLREPYFYLDSTTKHGAFSPIVNNPDGAPNPTPPGWSSKDGSRQNIAIDILEQDAVIAEGLDDGEDKIAYQQLLGYTANRPNIIYCGVHANRCLLNRYNSMRTLYRAGKSLWLVRDLTDCMSVPNDGNAHFNDIDVVVSWIGRHLNATTMTSDEVGLDLKRFKFGSDTRAG